MKNKIIQVFSILCIALVLSGCSTTKNLNDDPFEEMNRRFFIFNDKIDKGIVRPAATAYDIVTPGPLQKIIGNFFQNLGNVPSAVNLLLQGKFYFALESTNRFLVNSTIGILGFNDFATELKMPKNNSDFGLTLAAWGIKDSPYLVLPFIGPSTVRDGIGWGVDMYFFDPVMYARPRHIRTITYALRLIDKRAKIIKSEKAIQQASFDPYIFRRNAYLQQRHNAIYGEEDVFSTDDDTALFVE